jgi:hypothetical protein
MAMRWLRASTRSLMCVPVLGREKLHADSEGRLELRDVPPWMCWVAATPPTAWRDPAAWRDPEDEMAVRELAPGEAK